MPGKSLGESVYGDLHLICDEVLKILGLAGSAPRFLDRDVDFRGSHLRLVTSHGNAGHSRLGLPGGDQPQGEDRRLVSNKLSGWRNEFQCNLTGG